MARRKQTTREEAEQLALGWLGAQGMAAERAAVVVRAWDAAWRVRLWLSGVTDGEPDHYLLIRADGTVEPQLATRAARNAERRRTGVPRGPAKVLPEGVVRRERIPFVPEDEDAAEIIRLAEVHGLPAAQVVRELVALALRGVAPSWAVSARNESPALPGEGSRGQEVGAMVGTRGTKTPELTQKRKDQAL